MDYRLAAALAAWVDPVFVIHCAEMVTQDGDDRTKQHPSWISDLQQRCELANAIEQDLRRLCDGELEIKDKIELLACHRATLHQLHRITQHLLISSRQRPSPTKSDEVSDVEDTEHWAGLTSSKLEELSDTIRDLQAQTSSSTKSF